MFFDGVCAKCAKMIPNFGSKKIQNFSVEIIPSSHQQSIFSSYLRKSISNVLERAVALERAVVSIAGAQTHSQIMSIMGEPHDEGTTARRRSRSLVELHFEENDPDPLRLPLNVVVDRLPMLARLVQSSVGVGKEGLVSTTPNRGLVSSFPTEGSCGISRRMETKESESCEIRQEQGMSFSPTFHDTAQELGGPQQQQEEGRAGVGGGGPPGPPPCKNGTKTTLRGGSSGVVVRRIEMWKLGLTLDHFVIALSRVSDTPILTGLEEYERRKKYGIIALDEVDLNGHGGETETGPEQVGKNGSVGVTDNVSGAEGAGADGGAGDEDDTSLEDEATSSTPESPSSSSHNNAPSEPSILEAIASSHKRSWNAHSKTIASSHKRSWNAHIASSHERSLNIYDLLSIFGVDVDPVFRAIFFDGDLKMLLRDGIQPHPDPKEACLIGLHLPNGTTSFRPETFEGIFRWPSDVMVESFFRGRGRVLCSSLRARSIVS